MSVRRSRECNRQIWDMVNRVNRAFADDPAAKEKSMKITDVTIDDLQRLAIEFGLDAYGEPFIVPLGEAKQLEYAMRQAGALAVAMQKYEAAGNVLGALAFGVEIGLRLARGGERP